MKKDKMSDAMELLDNGLITLDEYAALWQEADRELKEEIRVYMHNKRKNNG